MKTIPLPVRFFFCALLASVSDRSAANTWVNVNINNSDAGEIDNPGAGNGVVMKNPDNNHWTGSNGTSWPGDFAVGGGSMTAASTVTVSLDPSSGVGYTNSPLYLTGTYFIQLQGFHVVLNDIMLTVISPDGGKNIETVNISNWNSPAAKNPYGYEGYHVYQWTIPITFTNPGTYYAYAALDYGATWYQDENTYSADGGNTWNFRGAPDTGYGSNAYLYAEGLGFYPWTNGYGNQISFQLEDSPSGLNRVGIQAIPDANMTLWFTPSSLVWKSFNVSGPTNPSPYNLPVYPPTPNIHG